MNDSVARTRLWAALIVAGILAGCGGDNPAKPKAPPSPQIVIRSSPQNVLHDLEFAYSNRDSIEIKSIYDFTYTGQSTDQTAPPGPPLLFTYVDEVEHVAALARAHSISGVTLKFGSLTRLGSDDVSHPEWATIQIPGSNMELVIDDAGDLIRLASGGITESFSFKPTTPDSTSPTDTTWKIVRWSEEYVGGGP